jgi:hypothetical protein
MASRKPGIDTRSKTCCPILGHPKSLKFWNDKTDAEGNILLSSPNMSGKQLPTQMAVMKHIAFLKKSSPNGKISDLASETCNLVSIYWKLANIPVQDFSKKKCKMYRAIERLQKLWKEYQIVKDRFKRGNNSDQEAKDKFLQRLSALFDISHADVESEINKDTTRSKEDKQTDIQFYHDQNDERKLVMGEEDRDYRLRYERKEERLQKESERSKKWQEEKDAAGPSVKRKSVVLESDSDTTDDAEDQDFKPPVPKTQKSEDYIPVLLPRKILQGEHVCQMADMIGETYRKHTGSVASVLQDARSLDGSPLDLKQFALSKNTDHRSRHRTREDFTEDFYNTFSAPDYTTVHWDEKFCKKVLGKDDGDKMIAILVSGKGCKEGLLVDMFSLESGEGITVAGCCHAAMKRCRCDKKCKVMVFDTTSTNSGIHKGAATYLQRDMLGYKMIWAACRKHVAELEVKAVYEFLFGKSKCPYFKELKYFQDIWMKQPTESDPEVLDKDVIGEMFEFTTEWEIQRAKEVAEELTKLRYNRKTLPRDDYREVLDMALHLNPYSTCTCDHSNGHCIKKPGAHNQCRWMCTCIYCLKMFWFKEQDILEYSEEFKAKLTRFVKWLLLIYIPYWFQVPLSSDAAVYDMQLYHSLQHYESIDAEISNTALTVQSRHLWYLAPEAVILFCLFGTELSEDERSRIAAKLLTKPRPPKWDLEKVKFPKLTAATTLLDLITEMSWFPFDLLELSAEWLLLPPTEWESDTDYVLMKTFARELLTRNDPAERGCKLLSDYSNILTTNSEERKKLVMVVQNHRKMYPKMKKETLN